MTPGQPIDPNDYVHSSHQIEKKKTAPDGKCVLLRSLINHSESRSEVTEVADLLKR